MADNAFEVREEFAATIRELGLTTGFSKDELTNALYEESYRLRQELGLARDQLNIVYIDGDPDQEDVYGLSVDLDSIRHIYAQAVELGKQTSGDEQTDKQIIERLGQKAASISNRNPEFKDMLIGIVRNASKLMQLVKLAQHVGVNIWQYKRKLMAD